MGAAGEALALSRVLEEAEAAKVPRKVPAVLLPDCRAASGFEIIRPYEIRGTNDVAAVERLPLPPVALCYRSRP